MLKPNINGGLNNRFPDVLFARTRIFDIINFLCNIFCTSLTKILYLKICHDSKKLKFAACKTVQDDGKAMEIESRASFKAQVNFSQSSSCLFVNYQR